MSGLPNQANKKHKTLKPVLKGFSFYSVGNAGTSELIWKWRKTEILIFHFQRETKEEAKGAGGVLRRNIGVYEREGSITFGFNEGEGDGVGGEGKGEDRKYIL